MIVDRAHCSSLNRDADGLKLPEAEARRPHWPARAAHLRIVDSRSIRTIPWVLGSTQRPVLEALCLQPLSGRHGMSPNALSRCGSAVELLAWLPILVGHTARVVSFLECHPADSKRAQRADL